MSSLLRRFLLPAVVLAGAFGAVFTLDFSTAASTVSVPTPPADPFPDVPESHPHAAAVDYVRQAGIVQGYGDGTYQPERTVNRAEFAKMYVAATYPEEKIMTCATDVYTLHDVPSEMWFAPYICVLMREGLARGYDDGNFYPERTINVAEVAKIITKGTLPSFAASTPWYRVYIDELAVQHALPEDIMTFDQPVTRGLLAELLYRQHRHATGAEALPSKTYESIAGGEITKKVTAEEKPEALYLPYTEQAFDTAVASNEPFAIFFYAAWCPSCIQHDQTFTDRLSELPRGVTLLRANYDTDVNLRAEYDVKVQDTLVFFRAGGVAQQVLTGASFAEVQDALTLLQSS
ncbi:S-layer homology domain-containing protein [Candidatus Peribacteria bacterium]|nr:S-layer homology domain-containing protein [Candidatus Peribacteria bacterium]